MKNFQSIILLSLLLTSCKKEFLTLNPQSEASAENYYKTAKDFNTALIGAYARFTDYPTMYFELSSYRSDELSLGAPTAGTQDRYNIDKFADDPSNQILLTVWGNLYNGISRCNEIIARLPDANLGDMERRQVNAEARFIRAYHYYHLVKFWGNVPLITRPVSPSESLRAGSVPSGQILSTLADDLRFAKENLPDRFASQADLGRATSGAATVLLAKVLMEQKNYAEVQRLLKPLLTSRYKLLNDIAEVFKVTNKNNEEVIFSIRYNKEVPGAGHGLWLGTTSAKSSLVPPKLLAAYGANDRRRDLLLYSRSGSSNNFVPNKFMDVISATTQNAENDWILLRFSEVLLMYSEAANELAYSPSGDAFNCLNIVHRRSAIADPNFTPAILPDQAAFRNAVQLEYKLELAYEGQRWLILTRTGKAASAIHEEENITLPTFRLLFPIPQTEVEKIGNPSIMPQNPGY
jgi:hypothetical protein